MTDSARKLRDTYAITPGAPLFRREFGYFSLEAWLQQGFPADADFDQFFHYDPPGIHYLGQLGWCEAAFEPAFEVKVLEEQARVEKAKHLATYWEGMAGALAEAVPYERIADPSWLNKTCHLEDAYKAIDALVERIFTDEQTLDSLGLSHPIEAKAEFFATLDLSRAIARSEALDDQEERARRLEAQKAENLAAVTKPAASPGADCGDQDPRECPERPDDVKQMWRFECTCTRAQFDGVLAYLKSQGITGRAVR
jgi:hypothetical protein